MRIVQIIDSLEAGGAERMAVNYANALSTEIEFSGLIATRKEGILKNQIDTEVSYLFLKKKKSIDFWAVLLLRKYLLRNKIEVIHAHSTSFFIAVLVKCTLPGIKIIWHDHYGISQDLASRKNFGLKFGSLFFKGIISVNTSLKKWADSNLFCSSVIFLPNFICDVTEENEAILMNGMKGKRIVCIANLRPQKNHQLLISAASAVLNEYPDWSFHLFGKDFKDDYSEKIKRQISSLQLEKNVFLYGTVENVGSALKQSDIAVLPSLSEGLPLAILEYGLYKLPVVATNVGEISEVITSDREGLIVESNNLQQFVQSIQKLIKDKDARIEMGLQLNNVVDVKYSQKSIIKNYVVWMTSLINFAQSNRSYKKR